jgi:hypothetical protein
MSVAADDRLLPATRWAALVIFIVLVPAVIVLWGTPGETADRWAWTIKPDLTPIFLGSGYGAGAYFFWRTFRATGAGHDGRLLQRVAVCGLGRLPWLGRCGTYGGARRLDG